ncbi:MAG: tRNA (guanosine(46)-N7)-methyltransferase TrmB [Gammaproteobacteria bacterium]|nr:tRNA (guanosine(46)-N7)-methyltransferase TrmB [Gammaproteobacteria bacterium]
MLALKKVNQTVRTIRSFVRREGKLTSGQKRALDQSWPRYGMESYQGEFDVQQAFVQSAPIVLEIGFGNGAALVSYAQQFPDLNWLGVEVHRPGIGHLLLQLEKNQIENVRLVNDDAVEILREMIPDQSLHGVHIFFPDPWPKKRHNKRRLVQSLFLDLVASKLEVNGFLHIATDWQNYAEAIEHELERHWHLHLAHCIHDRSDMQSLESLHQRPITKFERRGLKLDHHVADFVAIKSD